MCIRDSLYGDAINNAVVIQPARGIGRGVGLFDKGIIDGLVMGGSAVVAACSQGLRKLQNGAVRTYGLTMAYGVIIVCLVVILGRMA